MSSDTFTKDKLGWLDAIMAERVGASAFACAYAIASFMNRETRNAWPSRKTLARRLGVSTKAVQTAIRRLSAAGYLGVVAHRGPGMSSLFTMIMPPDRKHSSAHEKAKTSTDETASVEKIVHSGMTLSGAFSPSDWKKSHRKGGRKVPKHTEHTEYPSNEPIEYSKAEIGTARNFSDIRPKQGRRVPEDWPEAVDREWAIKLWYGRARADLVANIDDIAASARDHHLAKGTVVVDWPAAWRTWARNAIMFNRREGHRRSGSQSANRAFIDALARDAGVDIDGDAAPLRDVPVVTSILLGVQVDSNDR
jgi:hypothetical protein